MVSQFESELNKRLACDYSLVSSSCIPCDNDDDEQRRVTTRRGRKLRFLLPSIIALGNNGGGGYERSMIETVDESSMLGVSSLPKDVPDPVKGKCDDKCSLRLKPSSKDFHQQSLFLSSNLSFYSLCFSFAT